MLKFMRAGVMDPCTIREDVSRMVGLNGGACSLVASWAQAGFINIYRRLALKGKSVVFLNSRLF